MYNTHARHYSRLPVVPCECNRCVSNAHSIRIQQLWMHIESTLQQALCEWPLRSGSLVQFACACVK